MEFIAVDNLPNFVAGFNIGLNTLPNFTELEQMVLDYQNKVIEQDKKTNRLLDLTKPMYIYYDITGLNYFYYRITVFQ